MWVKRRHKVITTLLRPVFRLYLKIKYRATFSKKVSMPEGSIIISNHTTTLDPFMVGMLFKQNLYYMASKDLFNHRFAGKIIKFLVII